MDVRARRWSHILSMVGDQDFVPHDSAAVFVELAERFGDRFQAGPADLLFADTPYNLGIDYEGAPGDSLAYLDFAKLMVEWIASASRIVRPGALVWWLINEQHADFVGMALQNHIGPRVARVIWYEAFAQYNPNGLTRAHRHLFCHVKAEKDLAGGWSDPPRHTFNPDPIRIPSQRMLSGDKRASGPRVPDDVWRVRRLQGTSNDRVGWHPAQLPPEPLHRIVAGWSNPGDIVVDLFCGSGSMGRVAVPLGRRFVGVDASPLYASRSASRIAVDPWSPKDENASMTV